MLLSTLSSQALPAGTQAFGDTLALTTAQSQGMGGASRADPRDHVNIQLSPATLGLRDAYAFSFQGFILPGADKGLQVSAVDSSTSAVTLGMAWRYTYFGDLELDSSQLPGWTQEGSTLENTGHSQQVVLGLAYASPDNRVSLGLGGLGWWRTADVSGTEQGFRLGMSVAAMPQQTLTMAAGGSFAVASGDSQGIESMPWLDAGLKWQPVEPFSLSVDLLLPLPPESPEISLGTRLVPTVGLPFRFGLYHASGQGLTALTAGISIESDTLSLDYGLRVDAWTDRAADDPVPIWHGLGLRVGMQPEKLGSL